MQYLKIWGTQLSCVHDRSGQCWYLVYRHTWMEYEASFSFIMEKNSLDMMKKNDLSHI